jgi:hypothetical protein
MASGNKRTSSPVLRVLARASVQSTPEQSTSPHPETSQSLTSHPSHPLAQSAQSPQSPQPLVFGGGCSGGG